MKDWTFFLKSFLVASWTSFFRGAFSKTLFSLNLRFPLYYFKKLSELLNNMRSHELSKHLLGYAWRLEYGSLKGFHYHTFFFFDGSKKREDVNIAKMIGEYWVNVITKGRGLYYNCNAKKDQYKHCGIGMINDSNTELRQGLEIAARYLTKQDYYAKMDFNDKDGKKARTFGKGEITKPKSSRGRRRKTRHHQD